MNRIGDYVIRRGAKSDETYWGRYRYASSVRTSPGPMAVLAVSQCQRCATRLSQDEAHELAHQNGGAWTVVRIRPRKPKERT
jgi:hypothetical protein